MSRKSVSYTRGYEHSDFSDLLSELQGNRNSDMMIDGTAAIAIPSPVLAFPVRKESEERHRLMSNQKVKYFYSKQGRVIHDKCCDGAKCISDEELQWSENYLPSLSICPDCMIKAYILEGAKDPKEFDKYQDFFEKSQMSDEQIRNVYIDNGMKTRISPGIMTIWHKEDTWRIKCLPKKGHVQLYHNNYVVRKKGVREFTQGFHIQSSICADTDIAYALSIIKNYEYKPEEYALHNSKVNPIEKKKAKQKQAEKMEKSAVSLEVLLGERSETATLWEKVKVFVVGLFKKKNFFELNDFQLVAEQGFPKNQTVCIYIWKDKNGQISWQTGMYHQKLEQFSVRYGTSVYAIKQDKVIAWKKMNADATALDIECQE